MNKLVDWVLRIGILLVPAILLSTIAGLDGYHVLLITMLLELTAPRARDVIILSTKEQIESLSDQLKK